MFQSNLLIFDLLVVSEVNISDALVESAFPGIAIVSWVDQLDANGYLILFIRHMDYPGGRCAILALRTARNATEQPFIVRSDSFFVHCPVEYRKHQQECAIIHLITSCMNLDAF